MFNKLELYNQMNIQGSSPEEAYADIFLAFITTYLRNKGFTLYTAVSTPEVEEFSFFSFSQTIFTLPFWVTRTNLVDVEIKTHFQSTFELTTNYILSKRSKVDLRPYKQLELPYNVEKVKIRAIWGFGLVLPDDLYFAIYNILLNSITLYKKELESFSNNGKDLKSLKVDEITYNFGDSNNNDKISITDLQTIFDRNKTFQSILSYYV